MMKGQTERVLLVEDNPEDARLMQIMLARCKMHNFELALEETLSAALERLDQENFAAILIDLSLPDSHGLESLHRMRAAAPNSPIVVLTGLDDEEIAVMAMQAGAQDYLFKGRIDADMLVRCTRYAIERVHAEQAKKEALNIREEFIASMSHDLRSPLATIIGFLELLEKNRDMGAPTRQEFVSLALQEANHLTSLVTDILDISSINGRGMLIEPSETDLDHLIRNTLQSLERAAAEKEIRLSYPSGNSKLVARADARLIRRVLVNLVENAIKFSHPGGEVLITAEKVDGAVTVQITDQGLGIPLEEQSRVFDKFYQADSPAKRAGRGSGLGLYISKQIVAAHGGDLSVKSELGLGSTFQCSIPTEPADPAEGSL